MFTQEEIEVTANSLVKMKDFILEVWEYLPDDFEICIDFIAPNKFTNGVFEESPSLMLQFANNTTVDFTYMDVTPELTPKDVADKILAEHNDYLENKK